MGGAEEMGGAEDKIIVVLTEWAAAERNGDVAAIGSPDGVHSSLAGQTAITRALIDRLTTADTSTPPGGPREPEGKKR
jgi:hypothetical protein